MKREPTEAAKVAALIRKELKARWPATKFRVTSENYSGGDAVNIHWDFGPTYDQVNGAVHKYQGGEFDGMTDCYNPEHKSAIDPAGKLIELPSVSYVSCSRNYASREEEFVREFAKDYGFEIPGQWYNAIAPGTGNLVTTEIYRALREVDFTGKNVDSWHVSELYR